MEADAAEEGLSLARELSADLAALRRLRADTLGTAARADSFTRSHQLEEELGGALPAIGAHAHLPLPPTLPLGLLRGPAPRRPSPCADLPLQSSVSAPSRPSRPRRPCPGLVFRAPRPHARANA
jgi:hypothetical protein